MNGFATVLKVVIFFIILTDPMKVIVKFCVIEVQVLGEIMMYEGIRSVESLILGMPMATQGNILTRNLLMHENSNPSLGSKKSSRMIDHDGFQIRLVYHVII